MHDALRDHKDMVTAGEVDVEEKSNEMAAIEVPHTIIDPWAMVVWPGI